jgi:ubiquinone/menaquinone biosynthesis C-methylase UbiE
VQRVPKGDFRAHDLALPLDWLGDGSVDRVLFALAVEYVDDRTAALRELRRVLRPDGALVMSLSIRPETGFATAAATSTRASSRKPGAEGGRSATG